MPKKDQILEAEFSKLVHGGQALGELADGKKAFVWGVLPGEVAKFVATKSKRDFVEGIVTEILTVSKDRVQPKDVNYLSTSPWQILNESQEDLIKQEIAREAFVRAGIVDLPEISFHETVNFWAYRNKMEYSFYGDEDGLHLALHGRGSHFKEITNGSSIARREIDDVARKICAELHRSAVRAADLKTLMLRCNQSGEVVAALFVKDENFKQIESLEGISKGLMVVYSNPKSPASVRTKDLYTYGDGSLQDIIAGNRISYDVFSFFQVNPPVFNVVLQATKDFIGDSPVLDFYCGVGAIGLAFENVRTLVDSDASNINWAKFNAGNREGLEILHASSENVNDAISSEDALIVDPPRAGLHSRVIDSILEKLPPKIAYLSCNPSTQARDVAVLQQVYDIASVTTYNFFPRTPHIECLMTLVRK